MKASYDFFEMHSLADPETRWGDGKTVEVHTASFGAAAPFPWFATEFFYDGKVSSACIFAPGTNITDFLGKFW